MSVNADKVLQKLRNYFHNVFLRKPNYKRKVWVCEVIVRYWQNMSHTVIGRSVAVEDKVIYVELNYEYTGVQELDEQSSAMSCLLAF